MSSTRQKAVPLSDSESDSELDRDEEEAKRKRLKLIESQIKSNRGASKGTFLGGIVVSSESDGKDHSASASLSAAEKKGLKEVEELERELDLKNTFSKETNRRDEDAEMNKYIDEQIRLRREAAKKERQKLEDTHQKSLAKLDQPQDESDLAQMFTMPVQAAEKIDDILLHSLSEHLSSKADERSEAMLSSQMLNGIPEVDLGINERIRTIEATEEAKLKMACGSGPRNYQSNKNRSIAPANVSTNFQIHRQHRDARDGELKTSKSERTTKQQGNEPKVVTEPVVVVGQEPSRVEYRLPSTADRVPAKGRASDDYYVKKFKSQYKK